MENTEKTKITISASINAPVEKVWEHWNEPEAIKQWGAANDDWHTTSAINDLRTGGTFTYRMEAKDGSFGFDFGGTYDNVSLHKNIAYTMGDTRKVNVNFSADGNTTHVTEVFEAESENPIEMQQAGWQAILDNFKKYSENN